MTLTAYGTSSRTPTWKRALTQHAGPGALGWLTSYDQSVCLDSKTNLRPDIFPENQM